MITAKRCEKVLFVIFFSFVVFCFIGCKNPVQSTSESKKQVSETSNYLDYYIGHWSDINVGKNCIDIVISKDSVEGAVLWHRILSSSNYCNTKFEGINPSADGINGFSVDINYDGYKSCKITGHFRNADRTTLELQFHNENEEIFNPKFFTLYKHFY